MSDASREFTIELHQVRNYEFRVRFDDGSSEIVLDEPEPVGGGAGPNATRLLAAAVGHCLTSSLYFCASKARTELRGLRTEVTARLARNERKRLRVEQIAVRIHLAGTEDGKPPQIDRCLDLFEDYCIVTASVRQGVPVTVEVLAESGERLFAGPAG
jgi:uncharacterized OsmC-like protein